MVKYFDCGPNQYCIEPSDDFLAFSVFDFIAPLGKFNHVVDIPAGTLSVDDAINAFLDDWNCHGRAIEGHLREAPLHR